MNNKTHFNIYRIPLFLPMAWYILLVPPLTASELPFSQDVLMKMANEIRCSVSHGFVEKVGTQRVFLYANDVAAYDWIERQNTPYGTYRTWDYQQSGSRQFQAMPQYTLEKTYTFLLEGFRRIHYYGPDEVGRLLTQNGFRYTDGPGNDVVESLMICKKYGLGRFFFGAMIPEPVPYLNRQMVDYKERYSVDVRKEADWIQRLTQAFDLQIIGQSGQPWFYYTWRDDDDPLDVFLLAAQNDFQAVNRAFMQEHGFHIPLYDVLDTPDKRAQRIQFWQWVLRKFSELARVRGAVLRDEFGDIQLFTNAHAMVPVNYERWAEIFDHPGIDPRPMLTDNELAWTHYMGYCTRLYADLIDKEIMIAPRCNVVAAGARFIPTYNTVTYWYNQAIQNGAGYLLHWIHDFSGSAVEGQVYEGPCMGNPDASTMPQERWQAILDCASKLSHTKVFQPPQGDVGILVSTMTTMLDGWKNVFSAYIELRKAGVWTNFISDQELWETTESLDDYKIVFIPVMEFTRSSVIQQIMEYVKNGGIVVTSDADIFAYDEHGNSLAQYRKDLFGIDNIKRLPNKQAKIRTSGGIEIRSYGCQSTFTTQIEAEALAKDAHNRTAASVHPYGQGKAIYMGVELFDIYKHRTRADHHEDTGRYQWYASLVQEAGCLDLSWIWDITVDNIQNITGTVQKSELKIDDSIQFRNYMYTAGDRRITPYLNINW